MKRMEMLSRIRNISIGEIVYWLLLIDLIWGGAGRVISFGPLSFRIILLGIAFVGACKYCLSRQLSLESGGLLWLFTIVYFAVNLLVSLIQGNEVSNALNEFRGYITIAIIPFFVYRFSIDDELASKSLQVFFWLVLAFAVASIILWLIAYVYGIDSYMPIRRVLDSMAYGQIAFIGPVPRIFLKSSIFLTGGLLLAMKRLFYEKLSILNVFYIAVFTLAIITTFTMGFFAFSLVVAFLYCCYSFQKCSGGRLKVFLTVVFCVVLILIIAFATSVIDVMANRLSGGYSVQYKINQANQLLLAWSNRPLFGYGFGMSLELVSSSSLSTVQSIEYEYSFEIMWLQLLYHTGIIGAVLFGGFTFVVIEKAFRLGKELSNDGFIICSLFCIYLCLVSFTNPFMNNSIGLIAFSFIAGRVCCNNGFSWTAEKRGFA